MTTKQHDEYTFELWKARAKLGDEVIASMEKTIEALRAERDAWRQECELRTEDYQRAYRREMDNADRAEKAEAALRKMDAKMKALQELAIWMTGCEYDFTQHAYYMDNKHLFTWNLDGAALAPVEDKGGDDGR